MRNLGKVLPFYRSFLRKPIFFFSGQDNAKKNTPLFAWVKTKTPETTIVESSKANEEAPQKNKKTIKIAVKPKAENYFRALEVKPEDDLPLKLKQEINKASYVQNVMEIYERNEKVFTANGLIFLIKHLSRLFSKLMDDIETLHKNPTMQAFLKVLRSKIPEMNADCIVQTLILFRKFWDRKYFSKMITREDFDLLIARFRFLVAHQEMTFNEACLFFYESCYLRINTTVAFTCIDQMMRFEKTKSLMNAYYLTILMKALLINKDYKKNEIFWKNLLETVNYQITTLKDINILSQLFCYLVELDAPNGFNKNPLLNTLFQVSINNLTAIFNENFHLLLSFDLLTLLKGYSVGSELLDRGLLNRISAAVMENLESQDLYNFEFKLKFAETMCKTNGLTPEESGKILKSLLKHLKTIETIKMATFFEVVKSTIGYKVPEKNQILGFVNLSLRNHDLNLGSIFYALLIAKKMLDESKEFRFLAEKIRDFYKINIKKTFLERLSLIWDVAFHRSLIEDKEFEEFRENILETLCEKTKEKPELLFKVIDIFGDRVKMLVEGKNKMVQEFFTEMKKISELFNGNMSIVNHFRLDLFFDSSIIEQSSVIHILEKGKSNIKQLNSQDLEHILKFFRSKNVKTFSSFEIIERAIQNSQPEALKTNLTLIMNVVMELPKTFIAKNTDKVTGLLLEAFEGVRDLDPASTKDLMNDSYQNLLDLSVFLSTHGLNSFCLHGVFLSRLILEGDLSSEVSLHKLLEIGLAIAGSIRKREMNNILEEDHAIVVQGLRQVSGKIEIRLGEEIWNKKSLDLNDKSIVCRFLKIYYKANAANLKSKDSVFVNHCVSKLLENSDHKMFLENPNQEIKEFLGEFLLTVIGLEACDVMDLSKKDKSALVTLMHRFAEPEFLAILLKNLENFVDFFDQNYHVNKIITWRRHFNKLFEGLKNLPTELFYEKPFYFSRIFLFCSKIKLFNHELVKELLEKKKEAIFDNLHPSLVIDIVRPLAYLRHNDSEFFDTLNEMIKKTNLKFSPLQAAFWNIYLSEIGLNSAKDRDFSQKIIKKAFGSLSYKDLTNEVKKLSNYSLELFWALLFYESQNERLMTELLKCFEEEYYSRIQGRTKLKNKIEKLNQIYNFVQNDKRFAYLPFSKKFMEQMKKETLFRQNMTMDSKIFNNLLKTCKEQYLVNHFLLDTNYVNIYFPKRNLAILYLEPVFLCDDKKTPNGLGIMRTKVLRKLAETLKIIEVNLVTLEKMDTKASAIYLSSIGLDWLNNKNPK